MALAFSFDQIKLNANENVNNSVLNRPLARIYSMLEQLSIAYDLPASPYTETTYLADIYSEPDQKHYKEWHTIGTLSDLVPMPALTELSDTSKILPVTGQTVRWNQSVKKWEYTTLISKFNQLEKASKISDNPVDNAVIKWNQALNSWTAETIQPMIGVGYIYHMVCNRPTVVTLPTVPEALSGGEQIVITKLRPADSTTETRTPVLIVSKTNDDSSAPTIIGKNSILTNNENEDWASIHLRVVLTETGEYMWVPVCATGTWYPSDLADLTSEYTAGAAIDHPPQLTENQLKLQPYNIDLSINVDGNDISQVFNAKFARASESSKWQQTDGTGAGVYYNSTTKIISVAHSVLDGNKLVRAQVYYHSGNKLVQITPNEIYFELSNANPYSTVNIDVHEWLELATGLNLQFTILISI